MQAGMHAVAANLASVMAVPGGPSAIFAGAADRKLRCLEAAAGGALAVAAEVDAGAVVTQVLGPSPGAGCREVLTRGRGVRVLLAASYECMKGIIPYQDGFFGISPLVA